MKKKTFIVQLLDSKKPSRTSFTQVEDANFYSNDTDASLVFIPHEDTFDFETAKVVMYNRGDESLVERDAVVTTENGRKVASYELPADIIAHWGEWVAQPVFISNSEIYSGSIVPFSVIRYLMHERPPKLTEVVSVTEFIQQSQALVDDMEQAEAQRVTQEQGRQSAETNRVQAESERSDKYESYAQQFNDVITELSEEKDYHSLPEISVARRGYSTLTESLNNLSVNMFNTNLGKITPNMVSDELLAQIAGDAAVNAVPADGAITPIKTTFFNKANLFNPETVKVGFFTSKGVEIKNDTYYLSDFIPVDEGKTYIIPSTSGALGDYFDQNKSIVSRFDRAGEQPYADKSIFTVPAGVRFVKVNGYLGSGAYTSTPVNEFMMILGKVYPSEYIPFDPVPKIKSEYLPQLRQEDMIPTDGSVTPVKTTFFNKPNLFNPETVKEGFFTSNGTEIANGSYYLSDYIPVTQGQTYIMPATHSALGDYFDSSKSIVSTIARHHIEQPFADKSIFVVPPGVSFVKVSGFRGGTGSFVSIPINEFMLVEGDEYPSEYIPFGADPKIKSNYLPITTHSLINPLYNKKVVWNGDSIMGASPDPEGGWAGRVAKKNNMVSTNYAVGGGTIATGTYSSDNPRHWISKSVESMDSTADYVILEGGRNDWAVQVPLGEISSGYTNVFDDTTFCGALESMLSKVRKKYLGKKVGFIIVYKMEGQHYPYGSTSPKAEIYYDKAREILEKWSVPYLDLFKSSNLTVEIPEVKAKYFVDPTHINAEGYKVTTDQVERWMMTL